MNGSQGTPQSLGNVGFLGRYYGVEAPLHDIGAGNAQCAHPEIPSRFFCDRRIRPCCRLCLCDNWKVRNYKSLFSINSITSPLGLYIRALRTVNGGLPSVKVIGGTQERAPCSIASL